MFLHETEELVAALEGFVKAVQRSNCERDFVPKYREQLTKIILNIVDNIEERHTE